MFDVRNWLLENGFERFADLFEENEIDGEVLFDLTDDDLKDLGLALGPRKKLLKAINAVKEPLENEGASAESLSPPHPQARHRAGQSSAERRQLTVMFVDLVGSTALSEKLDPEDMRDVITGYQNAVAGVVTRFDGQVAKYMGDGVLCYFGWPKAHEDDAERAVRAGLAVMRALTRLKTPNGATLAARAGVATGLVVVGDLIGEGAAQEEAVVGETPNIAARMQALAEPDQVVVAEATRKLLSGVFDLVDLGAREFKGISGKTPAYVVTAERVAESRFEARSFGSVSAMVGRDHELALMLERWKQAAAGEGQLLLLTGEAGIGKSRITRAIIDAVAGGPHIRISYQCSPYHTDSSLYPAIQQLTFAAGIKDTDSNDEKLDKLEAVLVDGDTALIGTLLGLDVERRYGAVNMTPQQQRTRTLQALAGQLIALAQDKPVLFVLEDAHWIDASMLELLDICLDQIASQRVLMLITARPTFEHGFGGHPTVTKLTLNRLGREQVSAIVDEITSGKRLPGELLDEIATKTDGVPLFIEELTKTVLESGELRETDTAYELTGPMNRLAIPATLHDSLMARLDRLQPVKEVAQIAACIGRQFEYPLMESISPLDGAALQDALEQLIGAELIFRRGVVPDAIYTFKHALVQDTAYQSLLRSRRRAFHGRIAEVLAQDDSGQSVPELIAHHFTEADIPERAVPYWRQAGQRSLERSANPEAISQLERGMKLLELMPESDEVFDQRLSFLLPLGISVQTARTAGVPEVERIYSEAKDLAQRTGNPSKLFAALWGLWRYRRTQFDLSGARRLANQLLDIALQQDDPVFQLQAHHALWTTLNYTGEFSEAKEHVAKGESLYDREKHGTQALYFAGHDPCVCAFGTMASITWLQGNPDHATSWSDQAVSLARDLDHPTSLVHALGEATSIYLFRREPEAVMERVEVLIPLAEEWEAADFLARSKFHLGWAEVEMGKCDQGIRRMQTIVEARHSAGKDVEESHLIAALIDALIKAGRSEEGLELVDAAVTAAETAGAEYWLADLLRLKGELLLTTLPDGAAVGEAHFLQAISKARTQGAKLFELRATVSLARQLGARARNAEAQDLLAPIYNSFTEGFGTPDLMDARALLDQLS